MIARLLPRENEITIRMYRPGHGDCFLLALPREDGDEPVYILIDCGLKPGSQNLIHGQNIEKIVEHIGVSTNFKLDLVIITHEHQDHVNGFWRKNNPYFQDFTINKCWLAWTESPNDTLANDLRKRHRDQLLTLVEARQQLALNAGTNSDLINQLDNLISLEFGGEDDQFNLEALRAAASDPDKSLNKQSMKLVKDKSAENQGVDYLYPGGKPIIVNGSDGVRAFVLGPPYDEALLKDEDPVGNEAFPDQVSGAHGLSFSAALATNPEGQVAPFSERYWVPVKKAFRYKFFRENYGQGNSGENNEDNIEVLSNAPWRRIDSDWLFGAEYLALKLNQGINNTSLVLAFELPRSKKVLLFAADAQRGNWISWDDHTWDDDGREVKARDLLARTVLYKVGHHGSHNATLAGKEDDDYPNLSWMAKGEFKHEFTAMITAVNKWALGVKPKPWRHPLPSIRKALEEKAQGRVFQTDIDQPLKPANVSDVAWNAFLERSVFTEPLYFDYTVLDK